MEIKLDPNGIFEYKEEEMRIGNYFYFYVHECTMVLQSLYPAYLRDNCILLLDSHAFICTYTTLMLTKI